MPLILGANALTAGGFAIDNSLRFNSGSSDSLTKTTTTPDNRDKLTLSAWFKISSSSTSQEIFGFYGSNDYFTIRASNSNRIDVILYDGSAISRLITTQLLRDFSAWYHIVVVVDSANATADDRVKIYLNGNQITSFSTRTNPSQNQDFILSTLTTTGIGINTDQVGGVSRFNGYISEAIYIDNQALDPTSFGEFDEDSGIWKPIAYTGTFGTAGFYLEFKDSSALGDDTSGNSNDFTVNNLTSVDQSIDTPTNNFCTLNPLMKSTTDVVLTQGNLNMVSNFAGGWQHSGSTFAVKTGKWYWEAKATVVSATDKTSIGVVQFDTTQVNFQGNTNLDLATYGISGHGAGTGGYTYAQGDIILCAMDLDNNKVYWGKNGTYFGTLDPAAGTGATTQTIDNNNFCMPIVGGYGGSTWELNFGFPQFTVSSGNADANGYGNFEYAVPSGFYALNTKNLAEYG
jgi:hypothetical protein